MGPSRDLTGGAPAAYSRLQVVLHWTIAALIVVQLVYNAPMQAAFADRIEGGGGRATGGALFHIVVGSAVLILAVIRLAVRQVRGVPPPHDNPPIVNWAAHLTHVALYVMIFAMPLTGLVAWFGASETSATFHEIGRLILIGLIGLHVLGALVEQFGLRRSVFARIVRLSE